MSSVTLTESQRRRKNRNTRKIRRETKTHKKNQNVSYQYESCSCVECTHPNEYSTVYSLLSNISKDLSLKDIRNEVFDIFNTKNFSLDIYLIADISDKIYESFQKEIRDRNNEELLTRRSTPYEIDIQHTVMCSHRYSYDTNNIIVTITENNNGVIVSYEWKSEEPTQITNVTSMTVMEHTQLYYYIRDALVIYINNFDPYDRSFVYQLPQL